MNQIGRLNMDTSCLAWGNKNEPCASNSNPPLAGFLFKGPNVNARHGANGGAARFSSSQFLISDVNPAKPESPRDRASHGHVPAQHPVDATAVYAVAFRKSGLTPFTFNCDPQ